MGIRQNYLTRSSLTNGLAGGLRILNASSGHLDNRLAQGPQAAKMVAVKTLCFLGVGLLISCPAVGQDPSSFVTGISLVGGADSWPVFVAYVCVRSPAERAGVKSGNVLIAVERTRVSTGDEAFKLSFCNQKNRPRSR